MAKKTAVNSATGIVEQVQDEIEEIIEESGENSPTPTPMISKKPKFENKLDFSPVISQITEGFKEINSNLEKLIKPVASPQTTTTPEPKTEPRKYKWFDEFDPSISDKSA